MRNYLCLSDCIGSYCQICGAETASLSVVYDSDLGERRTGSWCSRCGKDAIATLGGSDKDFRYSTKQARRKRFEVGDRVLSRKPLFAPGVLEVRAVFFDGENWRVRTRQLPQFGDSVWEANENEFEYAVEIPPGLKINQADFKYLGFYEAIPQGWAIASCALNPNQRFHAAGYMIDSADYDLSFQLFFNMDGFKVLIRCDRLLIKIHRDSQLG